jgi:hypothetical protein
VDIGMPAGVGSGSGVDIGMPAGVGSGSGVEFGLPPAGAGSDSNLHGSVESGHGSAVDLGRPEAPADEMLASGSGIDLPGSDSSINLGAVDELTPTPASGAHLEEAEAGAAAEEEAVAAEEEHEPTGPLATKPEAPKTPPARPWVPWAGGALAGIGASVVLWMVGVQPPAFLRLFGDSTAPKTTTPPPRQDPGPPRSFALAAEHLNNGDLDKAREAGIDQANPANPQELARRGEFVWLTYLRQQPKPKAEDAPVQEAKEFLETATKGNPPSAEAFFWLGQIQEMTNDLNGARGTYQRGVKEFAADPVQKRRFEAALNRLELHAADQPAGPARSQRPNNPDNPSLMALLIALQAPPPGGEDASPDEEAGYDFWNAVALARKQKYAEALKALDKAREVHEKRRFTRLRKAQNPTTDPTEEIFLRTCDELKAFYAMQDKLRNGRYLDLAANKKDPVKALDEVITKASEGGTGAALKVFADKLIKEKVIAKPEEFGVGIEKLLADRKGAAEEAAKRKGEVEEAKKATDAAKAETKAAVEKAEAAAKETQDVQVQLKRARANNRQLTQDKEKADGLLKSVAEALVAAKFLDAKAEQAAVVQGVKDALKTASTVDAGGRLRELQAEVNRIKEQLAQRRQPEELLPIWLPALQNRNRPFALKAAEDARAVLNDAAAKPLDKVHAQAILGLALRNQEKFAEAKEALEKAKAGLKTGDNPWVARTEEALKEVSDPASSFLTRAATLESRGQFPQALTLLNRGLQLVPAADRGRILAQRAGLHLEMARAKAKGSVPANDPDLAAARKDAEEAARSGQAEGHFVAGQVAEEMGLWDDAIKHYRDALAAHPALDSVGSRYRMALARVLVQPRSGKPVAPPERTGRAAPAVPPRLDRKEVLLVLLTLALQGPGQPATDPAARAEAEALADEILRAKDVPFEARARAYAIKGQWSEALRTYANGLRKTLPRDQADGLLEIINNHPGLKRPDSLATGNPLEAEKHYASGLRWYFAREYPKAEKEFLAAVGNDGQDARYFYFLGLSRLAQGSREAYEDFEQAARLEKQDRPSPAAVSDALERIQGPVRRIVNEVRNRPGQ